MPANSVASARLSDQRPQIFCATVEGLFSNWKVDTDPNAAWSGWQQFSVPPQGGLTVATTSLTDGRPQLLAVNGIGQVWTTWQLGPDAPWGDWTQFPQLDNIVTVGAASLTDARPQLLAATRSTVFTTWKVDTEPDAGWADWTDFDGPSDVASVASANLTDFRPQIFCATGNGSLLSNWKVDPDPDAAWSGWQQFTAPPGGAIAVAGMSLMDDRPQIVAVNTDGQVWTTWKVDTEPDAAWADWTQFPQPGFAYTVGAARLTDGRPQIQVATETGLFTTWKLDTDPDAGWADWTNFNGPPGA
ncbi:hypothetical protein [Streptomyces sp. YGL11-2]|uniref:hypothetical protein n=1 Tax=Streptomyces sp. YGL11-2 TaxID=3414028 RepID=UPI003CFA21E5